MRGPNLGDFTHTYEVGTYRVGQGDLQRPYCIKITDNLTDERQLIL